MAGQTLHSYSICTVTIVTIVTMLVLMINDDKSRIILTSPPWVQFNVRGKNKVSSGRLPVKVDHHPSGQLQEENKLL